MTPPHSDAMVFFGGTGDLARKKIYPALLALSRRGRLTMPVIVIARSGWSVELLRERVQHELEQRGPVDEKRCGQAEPGGDRAQDRTTDRTDHEPRGEQPGHPPAGIRR